MRSPQKADKFHDLWAESGLAPLPSPSQVMISSALPAGFVQAGKDDYVGGLAGQVSGIIHEIKPARTALEEMVAETVGILARRLPERVKLAYRAKTPLPRGPQAL
jgi:nitronate monooxygenase